MESSLRKIPLWFLAPFVPMVASQIARLYQTTAPGWLLCDYSGRLGALAVLAAIPTARVVAFQRQPLRTRWWDAILWIVVLVTCYPLLSNSLVPLIDKWLPGTRLGYYLEPEGWLNVFDLTAGLMLVAYHEEVVFRRCARAVFSPTCGDGIGMIIASALLFAAFHWTTGLGNMTATFFFGLYAMFFLRRTGAIWPVVVAHFLTDFIQFSQVLDYL